MPGDVITEIFAPFVEATRCHEYHLQGRAIRKRYDWIGDRNVTSPDSFLLSKDAILAIELKFNAKTSLDQLGKYIALFAGEELVGGGRTCLNLLYVFPSRAE